MEAVAARGVSPVTGRESDMVERSTRTRRRQVVRVRTLRAVSTVERPDDTVRSPQIRPAQPAQRRVGPSPRSTASAPSRARSRQQVTILGVLLVLALAGLVVAGQRWYDQRQLVAAHQAALAAAKQTTVDFVTISAATVDRDLQRVAAGATGDFREEFTRGIPQVRLAVIENQVESTGSVLRAALVSGDLDSAVVLVAVDASVKNTGAPEGRLSHYRIQVDLAVEPESGRWLVSRLQFIG